MTFASAEFLQKSDPENTTFLAHFVEKEPRSEAVARWFGLNWIGVGCERGLASSAMAMLPIRPLSGPVVMLLSASPILIWMLIDQVGWLAGVIALFAFLSMFRNHMIYMAQCLMGQRSEIPK